jgi:GNAT superfamily N-acetyltransferase
MRVRRIRTKHNIMPSSHIRRAVLADEPRIFEIRFAVRENKLSNPELVTSADVKWFIENPGIWLWGEAGVIKGFSASDTRDGTIWALFVDPAFEGQGIGQALLDAALVPLRTAGHRIAKLSTGRGTRAERFYRTAGWTEIGLTEKDETLFERSLS